MRSMLCVSALLALAGAFCQPAFASCDGTAGHAHSQVDEITTSCVTLDAVMAGDIAVSGAWARAMLPGQPTGVGFLTLENKGTVADRLVSISSEAAAKVEVHTMQVKDGVMVMRPVEAGLAIAPGETVALEPGGMHLMFMDVDAPFAGGQTISVTLSFEKAGEVEIELPVAKAGAKGPEDGSHHTH